MKINSLDDLIDKYTNKIQELKDVYAELLKDGTEFMFAGHRDNHLFKKFISELRELKANLEKNKPEDK